MRACGQLHMSNTPRALRDMHARVRSVAYVEYAAARAQNFRMSLTVLHALVSIARDLAAQGAVAGVSSPTGGGALGALRVGDAMGVLRAFGAFASATAVPRLRSATDVAVEVVTAVARANVDAIGSRLLPLLAATVGSAGAASLPLEYVGAVRVMYADVAAVASAAAGRAAPSRSVVLHMVTSTSAVVTHASASPDLVVMVSELLIPSGAAMAVMELAKLAAPLQVRCA